MSCRELERLFLSDGSDAAAAAHREACGECARLGADLDRLASSAADLRAPAWSPGLRRALLEVPRMTVSCEAADGLTAALLEGEIEDADARRLRSHLSRCAGCAEAAETLGAMRSLSAPAPAPWLTTKLGATRPPKKRSLLALRLFRPDGRRLRLRGGAPRHGDGTQSDRGRAQDRIREPRRVHAAAPCSSRRARSATASALSRRKPCAPWRSGGVMSAATAARPSRT